MRSTASCAARSFAATALGVIVRVQTARGGCFDYRLFEFCQPGPDWASYTEAVVFPASADRIVSVRVERGEGPGAVGVRGLCLQEQGLRFDHRVRPLVSVPREWGPTRAVRPQTAEAIHRPGLTALSPQAALPIFLGARSALPPRTMATLHLALPTDLTDLCMVTQGHPGSHVGRPVSCGEVALEGGAYHHWRMPTMLFSAQTDGQAVGFLRPQRAPGEVVRLAYWLEWEGGRQAPRWLEAEVVDLPAAPALKHFAVSLPLAFPWTIPQTPELAALLRRIGVASVEIGDIVGRSDQREATFDFLRAQGITPIGGFSPGFWYPYQTALTKDPEMQAQGLDGRPVPTDHGPAACPSYRGPLYQQQMDLMRVFAGYGLEEVSFDEEFFGPGPKLCFCPRCRQLWDRYRAQQALPADVPLERIAQEPQRYPVLARAWAQFKADLMTEWYRDYRAALTEELAKTGRAEALRMYATCQTTACGAGETEFLYIMRDNAARLSQGLVQGLLPMPYCYQAYYDGSLRKVGEDLIGLHKLWGPHSHGKPSLLPYLLAGGAGMCYVDPQCGLKYQLYEAFTTGAVSGATLWHMKGMDGYHYCSLAQALHALAQVEDILWEGEPRAVTCTPVEAAARAIVKGERAVLFVSHYGYDPVPVSVRWPTQAPLVVEDAEDGAVVATVPAGAQTFPVAITRERARLLRVRPR